MSIASSKNEELRSFIHRVKVDETWMSKSKELSYFITKQMANSCSNVLDIGKSSRELFNLFKKDQITTFDINQFKDYPDYIVDVCDMNTYPDLKFDGIICHSILEHTYDPFSAVKNLSTVLKSNGIFLGFVPFLMEYHAPKDLKFQDFYRFSRDGIAYMFRDFEDITIYPVRNQLSTAISLLKKTKKYETKKGKEYISALLDWIKPGNSIQTTGFIIHATK